MHDRPTTRAAERAALRAKTRQNNNHNLRSVPEPTPDTATKSQRRPPNSNIMAFRNFSGGLLSGGAIVASPLVLGSDKKETLRTHPEVKLPPKLSNMSREEQIARCAQRVQPHSMAVDTLLRTLTAVRDAPDDPRFRTIDRANANYAAHVRDVPGAEDLLRAAANYRRAPGGRDALRRAPGGGRRDADLVLRGIAALERARTSPAYREDKRRRAFHAEMRRVARRRRGGGVKAQRRAGAPEGGAVIPREPPPGRGTRVVVQLGAEEIAGGRVERRFDGDDTLQDVLNWLGERYGGELLERLRGIPDGRGDSVREWCLCDLNSCPPLPLDVVKHGKSTLQYLGLFPSGKLRVRLSDPLWRDQREGSALAGGRGGFAGQESSRGLAAASPSML